MLKNIFILSLSILISNTVSHAQGGGLIIGTNYRIFPGNTTQSEVFITGHPTNTDILFVSANTIRFQPNLFISEGIYVSTNAGTDWYGSDTCNGPNIFFHGGDPSISIDKNGTFILTRRGSSSFPGAYTHNSTDNGLTWSVQKTISTDVLERATIASDNNPNSNYYGRTYCSWAKLVPDYSIGYSHSDDGGQNWITPFQINNPSVRGAGGEVALGLNGEVYVCWAGLQSVSPFTEIQVGFASSTNGGTNWYIKEHAFAMNGIQGLLASKQNIRVNGLPRMAVDVSTSVYNGTIYIVTSQKNFLPAGNDPDIILHKSTDGGLTWSGGTRVNQDPINNGKHQFFPGIAIDQSGGINIIFYDDRNTTSDSSGISLARSLDGGSTWTEYQISDHNFKPNAIGGLGQGYMGDNIDIAAVENKLYPVWMDNSTGIYQIWTVPIEITTVGIENDYPKPISFVLEQNYPNPFNPVTKIKYTIPVESVQGLSVSTILVRLKVYDIMGRDVATLVNEEKYPGTYEVEFDAAGIQKSESTRNGQASGVYFYRLQAGNYSETKKMTLIK